MSFFEYNRYIAIIGDIKKSRQINERMTVQKGLLQILNSINVKYEKSLASKFIITLGDEFQGLLCTGEDVLEIIEEIQEDMYPIQVRFGIGIGKITTDINAEMAIGADGPAYYMAREAIEILKQNEKKNKTQISDIRIEIENDKKMYSLMLNTIFSLMAALCNDWSERQRQIIREFGKFSISQAECAERLNITQSTVQRALINGKYYEYKSAKETVNSVLKEIGNIGV